MKIPYIRGLGPYYPEETDDNDVFDIIRNKYEAYSSLDIEVDLPFSHREIIEDMEKLFTAIEELKKDYQKNH